MHIFCIQKINGFIFEACYVFSIRNIWSQQTFISYTYDFCSLSLKKILMLQKDKKCIAENDMIVNKSTKWN